MKFIIHTIAALFFWWLFYERYYQYRDCIQAASSSCYGPEGNNLISGGAVWSVPALFFSSIAAYQLYKLIRHYRGREM